MKAKGFFITMRLITAITFLLIGSCTTLPMKGYDGPDLSADKTAVIENGVYLHIDKCDGMRLGFFQSKVIVLPGKHTIDASFQSQTIGSLFIYSDETASVTFTVEAGHTYVAYAHWDSTQEWIAYVKDKKTNERIAQSETLPIIQVNWVKNLPTW